MERLISADSTTSCGPSKQQVQTQTERNMDVSRQLPIEGERESSHVRVEIIQMIGGQEKRYSEGKRENEISARNNRGSTYQRTHAPTLVSMAMVTVCEPASPMGDTRALRHAFIVCSFIKHSSSVSTCHDVI